jgi:hypothetical protein
MASGHFLVGIRGSQPGCFHEDYEPGVSGIVLANDAALKFQISKRTLEAWEQDGAVPRVLARTAIENVLGA